MGPTTAFLHGGTHHWQSKKDSCIQGTQWLTRVHHSWPCTAHGSPLNVPGLFQPEAEAGICEMRGIVCSFMLHFVRMAKTFHSTIERLNNIPLPRSLPAPKHDTY